MTDILERRLRELYHAWNNPTSPELPEGAELLLTAADTITALRARVGELEGQVAAVRSVEAGLDGLLSLTDFTSDDFRDACDALSGAPSDLSARLSNRYNIILSALEVAGNAFQLASFHARSILSSTEDEK